MDAPLKHSVRSTGWPLVDFKIRENSYIFKFGDMAYLN